MFYFYWFYSLPFGLPSSVTFDVIRSIWTLKLSSNSEVALCNASFISPMPLATDKAVEIPSNGFEPGLLCWLRRLCWPVSSSPFFWASVWCSGGNVFLSSFSKSNLFFLSSPFPLYSCSTCFLFIPSILLQNCLNACSWLSAFVYFPDNWKYCHPSVFNCSVTSENAIKFLSSENNCKNPLHAVIVSYKDHEVQ